MSLSANPEHIDSVHRGEWSLALATDRQFVRVRSGIAERVSWFGCPANSEAEITKAATYVSPHEEVEGVLDILDHLVH